MYLFINTSNREEIFLALADKQGQILISKKIKAKYQQSEKLLENIDKIIKDAKIGGLKKLTGVMCVTGPGGFTSLRIGVATANTLAWTLQIPIIGLQIKENQDIKNVINEGTKKIKNKKTFRQILPTYGGEPNIG